MKRLQDACNEAMACGWNHHPEKGPADAFWPCDPPEWFKDACTDPDCLDLRTASGGRWPHRHPMMKYLPKAP